MIVWMPDLMTVDGAVDDDAAAAEEEAEEREGSEARGVACVMPESEFDAMISEGSALRRR